MLSLVEMRYSKKEWREQHVLLLCGRKRSQEAGKRCSGDLPHRHRENRYMRPKRMILHKIQVHNMLSCYPISTVLCLDTMHSKTGSRSTPLIVNSGSLANKAADNRNLDFFLPQVYSMKHFAFNSRLVIFVLHFYPVTHGRKACYKYDK